MSFSDRLFRMMERAENPLAIKAIARGLELATGVKSVQVIGSFDTVSVSEWYKANGYRGIAAFGGTPSYTGKSITIDTAFESAAFYAGVKMIAEDIGSLPFVMYQRSADGLQVDKATAHPLYPVLHDLWNPEVSAGEGVEALTAHAILTGNGFAHIQRVNGAVAMLTPWQPGDVKIELTDAGRIGYQHRENNRWMPYPRTDVLHLKGFTITGTYGDSLLERAKQVLGLTLVQQEYPSRWFAQGSMMDVVLERPVGAPKLDLQGIQLLKEAWIKYHKGLGDKAFEPGILQEGTVAKVLTPKMSEIQMVEQRKFQVLEICRVLRLTPHKLAEMERSAYASIEAENNAYIQLTLSPWNRRWKQAVHRCLLTPAEQSAGRYFAEQNVEALQRGDFQTQSEGWRKLLEKGVFSINEVRRLLNLNPIPGGDEHFIQLNMGTVAEIAAGLNLPNSVVPVKPKEPPAQGV